MYGDVYGEHSTNNDTVNLAAQWTFQKLRPPKPNFEYLFMSFENFFNRDNNVVYVKRR